MTPGDPAPTLQVRAQLSRGRGGFALDVDFQVPPDVTVLFGPSGAGKSTTLSAIAGLVRPQAGRIALGDEAWFDHDARIHVPVHRRRVAFVFQSLALFPHMTAIANVAYGMDGAPGHAREQRARELLDRLKAGHLADRRPATFSGGEAQRVALARALATSPRVILLDEPFSALDRDLRAELIVDLRALVHELHVPVVFVTHHPAEARALGHRVVVLDRGRVARIGSVEEVVPTDGGDTTCDERPLDPSGTRPR